MAYKYWDAGAFSGATDDAPLSSAALVRARRNLEQISDERMVKSAAVSLGDIYRRWHSLWPAVAHVQWIYIDDPLDSITVRLRAAIDVSVGYSSGSWTPDEAVALYATTATNGVIDLPPDDVADWAGDGLILDLVTVGNRILTADSKDRRGWVAVLVWIKSEINTNVDFAGEIFRPEGYYRTNGQLYLDVDIGAVPASNPPERAMVLTGFWGDQGTEREPFGDPRLLQFCDDHNTNDAADRWISVSPPVGLVGSASSASLYANFYAVGVCEVYGITVEQIPRTLTRPDESLLYNSEPARWQGVRMLARESVDIARRRVPLYGSQSSPAQTLTHSVDPDIIDTLPWRMFADSARGTTNTEYNWGGDINETTWTAITAHAVISADTAGNGLAPADDRNGWHSKTTIAVYQNRHTDAASAITGGKFRLRALDLAQVEIVAGDEVEIDLAMQRLAIGGVASTWPSGWVPLGDTVVGTFEFREWGSRGMLANPEAPNVRAPSHDWYRLSHVELTLPETDLTYPCIITVEMKSKDRWSGSHGVYLAVITSTLGAQYLIPED